MTPQQMLADAQMKLHMLLTGRLAVEIVVEGQTVRYTRTNLGDLQSYISRLQAMVASPGRPSIGAIGILF